MQAKFITIEREYGSGGVRIARRLAEETGVPCYGREILESVAERYNISAEDIEKYEEGVTNSFLYTIFAISQASTANADMLSREGHVFVAEQAEIQRLAAGGRAIFLGHCAAKALEGYPNLVRVFICCRDDAVKKARIMEDYGVAEPEVDASRKRVDKKRANYYYANTARRWNDPSNYDLMLDSAVLGIDGSVAVLKSLLAG